MKKLICIILSLLLLATVLCGCASEAKMDAVSNDVAYRAPMEQGGYSEGFSPSATYAATTYAPEQEVSLEKAETPSVADNRKLIRRLSLSAETENYTELIAQIENHVHVCGGYIENMEASTRYASKRYANLTIRVPADMLDEFAGYVGEVSNIVYRSESSKDITTTYVDIQSRRDALKTEYDRLLDLLEQANSLDEILQIESRMTNVRYELQNIESQLRTYDNLVDYATITLDITEVTVYTEVEEKGFWEELGDDFLDSIGGAWKMITGIFAGIVVALPYLLLISIIPFIVLCIYTCRKKKRNAEKQAPPQDPQ